MPSAIEILLYHYICISSETKKRSNFLCSIICCLGKKSSKYKGGKKGRESFSTGKGNGGSGASGSGDICPDSKPNSQSKTTKQLLPEIRADDVGKKCIVIDLDETLVHSSFKVIQNLKTYLEEPETFKEPSGNLLPTYCINVLIFHFSQ